MKNLDKITHAVVNYAIVLSIPNLVIGVIVAIILSLLKEFLWDKHLRKGQFDTKDLLANGLGILAGVIYKLII